MRCIFLSEVAEELLKFLRIAAAHIGWHLHAREYDLHFGIFSSHPVDDLLQVGARFGNGNAAQSIVATKFQHENINGLFQDPVDAVLAARRSLAAQTSIHYLVRQAE